MLIDGKYFSKKKFFNLRANFLVDGLFEMLSINNGPNFT
jgi:hypothetical protein